MVQSVTHTEAEIQQMYNLLQDLESSMNSSKHRQEEVRPESADGHLSGRKHTTDLLLRV